MATAAGLVVGAVGLAGLFGQAVQCFNMLQLGVARNYDTLVLHQKLDNQKARFLIWGESINLNAPSRASDLDHRPLVQDSIMNTMTLIISLFTASDQLRGRYGLVLLHEPNGAVLQSGESHKPFRRLLHRFSVSLDVRRSQSRPQTQRGNAARWVIVDRSQFLALVADLRELIDDLECLTRSAETTARSRDIISRELETLSENELLLIEQAAEGGGDIVADAASSRLATFDQRTIQSLSADSVSLFGSFYTAPEDNLPEDNLPDLVAAIPSQIEVPSPTIDLMPMMQPEPSTSRLTMITPIPSLPQARRLSLTRPPPQTDDIATVGNFGSWPEDNATFMSLVTGTQFRDRCASFDLPPAITEELELPTSPTKRLIAEMRRSSLDPHNGVTFHPLGSLRTLLAAIAGPPNSPYEDGTFFLRIQIPENYAFKPPYCCFLTKVYHPNIDPRGAICLDQLSYQWSPATTLPKLLLSIVSLLSDPNPDDPFVPEIGAQYSKDRQLYNKTARQYTEQFAKLSWPTDEMLARPMIRYQWLPHDIEREMLLRQENETRARLDMSSVGVEADGTASDAAECDEPTAST